MWDAAVYAHADRGDPAAAAAAVDAMRARRIPVGYVAHSCVVRAFCTADDFEVSSLLYSVEVAVCLTPAPPGFRSSARSALAALGVPSGRLPLSQAQR